MMYMFSIIYQETQGNIQEAFNFNKRQILIYNNLFVFKYLSEDTRQHSRRLQLHAYMQMVCLLMFTTLQ